VTNDPPLVPRVIVYLSDDERLALQQLADREMRPPRDQARLLVRTGLEQAGALPPSQPGRKGKP